MDSFVCRCLSGARCMHFYVCWRFGGAGCMDFYVWRHPWGAGCVHFFVWRRPWGAGCMHFYVRRCFSVAVAGEQDVCIFACAGAPGEQDVCICTFPGIPRDISRSNFLFFCFGGVPRPDAKVRVPIHCILGVLLVVLEAACLHFYVCWRLWGAGCTHFDVCRRPWEAGCMQFYVFWRPFAAGSKCDPTTRVKIKQRANKQADKRRITQSNTHAHACTWTVTQTSGQSRKLAKPLVNTTHKQTH